MRPPGAVIVTGGTGALGGALVRQLLALGTRVAVPTRGDERWQQLRRSVPSGDGLVGLEAEITSAKGARAFVEAAVEALGSLDGLALVAGGWAGGAPFESSPSEEWAAMMGQNLETAAHTCRAALPHLLRRGGSIVAVGSVAAHEGGADMAAYSVSKAALHALVRVLALENARRGVRVNAVLPGTIDTPANRRAMPRADTSSWTPPEAIARAMAWLLSPDSAPVNGALLPVAGAVGAGSA